MLRPDQIFDGHNDALTRYTSSAANWTFAKRSSSGHLDLPRAREGSFVGGFFAIFPGIEEGTWAPQGRHMHREPDGSFRIDLPPMLSTEFAYATSQTCFDRLDATVAEVPGDFVMARTFAEVQAGLDRGAVVAIAHFEGAEALGDDLRHFDHFYDRGLRSVGPVWSRQNAFGTGVPFAYPAGPDIGPGLTDAGRELVRACDSRGVVIDLAHLNEAGFWDVAELTTRPLVVTHTGVHALAQKPRNLTDKQIDAVGESGGVIGVTFFTGDLTAGRGPNPLVGVGRIAEHVRYIADRIGPEHVALGSDFDGAPIPRDMKDATGLPILVSTLRGAGFDDGALGMVTNQNWLRVLSASLSTVSLSA